MISVTLSQLTDILNGELQGADITLDAVTTDTRKLTPGCLFVALKGERFDAHDFADQAKAGGAGALLVSRPLDIDLPQLIVKDTRLAFGELAAWVRQQVPARVVALTGSSGKTSVKEMTAAILSQCGNTLYTAGNLNNDIAVPMTLLRLTPEYDFAVIELGANHQGEIAWTVSLTRPEAALVNNLAAAHLEGFGSLAGVAKAKGEIFSGLPENGIAIMNADNNDWLNWQSVIGSRKVWRFSPNAANSDFTATNIHDRSPARNLPSQPQQVASMFCCRCRASQYCECAGSRCALHVRGRKCLMLSKRDGKSERPFQDRLFPSNWRKTSCCSTTPTTPMSVQ